MFENLAIGFLLTENKVDSADLIKKHRKNDKSEESGPRKVSSHLGSKLLGFEAVHQSINDLESVQSTFDTFVRLSEAKFIEMEAEQERHLKETQSFFTFLQERLTSECESLVQDITVIQVKFDELSQRAFTAKNTEQRATELSFSKSHEIKQQYTTLLDQRNTTLSILEKCLKERNSVQLMLSTLKDAVSALQSTDGTSIYSSTAPSGVYAPVRSRAIFQVKDSTTNQFSKRNYEKSLVKLQKLKRDYLLYTSYQSEESEESSSDGNKILDIVQASEGIINKQLADQIKQNREEVMQEPKDQKIKKKKIYRKAQLANEKHAMFLTVLGKLLGLCESMYSIGKKEVLLAVKVEEATVLSRAVRRRIREIVTQGHRI